jgi:hypothetical protein
LFELFFLFSFLTTKMHNYHLLFVICKGLATMSGSRALDLETMFGVKPGVGW